MISLWCVDMGWVEGRVYDMIYECVNVRYRQDEMYIYLIYAFQANSTMHARSPYPYITNLIRTLTRLLSIDPPTSPPFLKTLTDLALFSYQTFSARDYISTQSQALHQTKPTQKTIRNSIVVSIPACHVGDLGSIPSCGASCTALLFAFFSLGVGSDNSGREEEDIFLLGGREEE